MGSSITSTAIQNYVISAGTGMDNFDLCQRVPNRCDLLLLEGVACRSHVS